MISKRKLLDRIAALEQTLNGHPIMTTKYPGLAKRVSKLEKAKGETLSVPVVDKEGEPVLQRPTYSAFSFRKTKRISFEAALKAFQELCGVEITYQEIPGSEKVVIYEKEET